MHLTAPLISSVQVSSPPAPPPPLRNQPEDPSGCSRRSIEGFQGSGGFEVLSEPPPESLSLSLKSGGPTSCHTWRSPKRSKWCSPLLYHAPKKLKVPNRLAGLLVWAEHRPSESALPHHRTSHQVKAAESHLLRVPNPKISPKIYFWRLFPFGSPKDDV